MVLTLLHFKSILVLKDFAPKQETMRTPYIGITDFESKEQVLDLLPILECSGHRLMVGVMMSFKTLNGIKSKWTKAWVPKEQIAPIFIDHPLVFNAIHYADYDGVTELDDLLRAASYGGENLHTLQLDMPWPNPDLVREFREKYPETSVVLQVGSKALEEIAVPETFQSCLNLCSRLKEYGDAIDFVLLDLSGGRGKEMRPKELFPYALTIDLSNLNLGIAVAGGLGPDTLHHLDLFLRRFPDLSIDAQGKLRPSGNALDPIDWSMAKEYLLKAAAMFSS